MDNAVKKKKKKPLRRAQHWGSRVMPMAMKLVVPMIAIIVMGLMFSALQAVGQGLRIMLALVIIAGMLLFLFSEGLNRGAEDAAAILAEIAGEGDTILFEGGSLYELMYAGDPDDE